MRDHITITDGEVIVMKITICSIQITSIFNGDTQAHTQAQQSTTATTLQLT